MQQSRPACCWHGSFCICCDVLFMRQSGHLVFGLAGVALLHRYNQHADAANASSHTQCLVHVSAKRS